MAKKKRNRLSIDFSGFEEYYEKFDRLNADSKKITEKALQKSYEMITPGIKKAIQPHHLTGATENALRENEKVEWQGNLGTIHVGFSISEGGLASIFLMYGTPRIDPPDKKLYNSIYGAAIKKKAQALQKEIFDEELKKVMK